MVEHSTWVQKLARTITFNGIRLCVCASVCVWLLFFFFGGGGGGYVVGFLGGVFCKLIKHIE